MIIQKCILINRAPFDKLYLDFNETNIAVLSGINGTGKTTILSYIVDAFYEAARKSFPIEFEGKSNKYYRVSSNIHSLVAGAPSAVYLRFKDGDEIFDYVDVRNCNSQEQYNGLVDIDQKIPYTKLSAALLKQYNVKLFDVPDDRAEKMFSSNILTYFPSYRYEQPGYLNDLYKMELSFKLDTQYRGYLNNPIEVTSDLPEIANWIMDVILDRINNPNVAVNIETQANLNSLFTRILYSKTKKSVRLGIGERHESGTRIQIMDVENDIQVYPTIFNMSSGELALLCMFGELIKQSDKLRGKINEVSGIVLIDEVDKHLHIKLQKEVLPELFKYFPNLQFIVSSHAPFLTLGLAAHAGLKSKVIDLDNGGCICAARNNALYNEVYKMMINENMRFKNDFDALKAKVEEQSRPLVITEGKSDYKHLKAAQMALNLASLDIQYYEGEESRGDTNLHTMLQHLSKIPNQRKVIGVFDRDSTNLPSELKISLDGYIELSNKVYIMVIPLVNQEVYNTDKISIEHYYNRQNLLKEDSNGRRLFLGSEFYESGNSKDKNFQTKASNHQNKTKVNGIIDEKVYRSSDPEQLDSCVLSKNAFADLVLNDNAYREDMDFSNFIRIFDVIRQICEPDHNKPVDETSATITPSPPPA